MIRWSCSVEAQRLAGILDLGGHRDVGIGRGGVARGVVVHQDQRAGVQFQRALHDLTRVDRDMVDGALGLFLIGDQHVLAVKKQDAELFGFAVGHGGVAIVQQRIPGRQDGRLHHPGAHHALGGSLDHLQLHAPRRRRRP